MLVVNPAEEIYKRNKGQVVDQIETRSANEGKTEKYLSFKISIHPIQRRTGLFLYNIECSKK